MISRTSLAPSKMRMTICRSKLARWGLLAGALVAPARLAAQQSSPETGAARTHVVKRGETLRSIARDELGKPERWPELYRLNRSILATPHRIRPGQRLALTSARGRTAPVAAREARRGRRVPLRAAGASRRPARPTTPAVTPVASDAATSVSPKPTRTIFFGRSYKGFAPLPDSMMVPADSVRDARPRLRAHEAEAAPFVVPGDKGRRTGRIVATGGGENTDTSQRRAAIGLRDMIPISLPLPVAARVGDRLLAYRFESELAGYGQVARPTGILQLGTVSPEGVGTARVMSLFDVMSAGDLVEPMSALTAVAAGVVDASARPGPRHVLWVESGALTPALQRTIIVDLTTASGARPGDLIALTSPAGGADGGQELARAVLLRVGSTASTAMLVAQRSASLAEGTEVKVLPKLP